MSVHFSSIRRAISRRSKFGQRLQGFSGPSVQVGRAKLEILTDLFGQVKDFHLTLLKFQHCHFVADLDGGQVSLLEERHQSGI